MTRAATGWNYIHGKLDKSMVNELKIYMLNNTTEFNILISYNLLIYKRSIIQTLDLCRDYPYFRRNLTPVD
jgi:hypothetical protein